MRSKIFFARLKIFLVGLIGSLVLRALNRSLRWETVGFSGENRYWPSGKPRIIAFWHGQQLFMPWIYLNQRKGRSDRPFVALISQHDDGRMIAKAMNFLGIDSVAGSSSKSGREALFALIDKLKTGSHVAITPDGPRGPAHKLKSGVVRIAERSGAAIYPAAISAEKSWTFRSWDKMMLPKPFSRAVLIIGEKISIPAKLPSQEVERYSKIVEDALNATSRQAQEYRYGTAYKKKSVEEVLE